MFVCCNICEREENGDRIRRMAFYGTHDFFIFFILLNFYFFNLFDKTDNRGKIQLIRFDSKKSSNIWICFFLGSSLSIYFLKHFNMIAYFP